MTKRRERSYVADEKTPLLGPHHQNNDDDDNTLDQLNNRTAKHAPGRKQQQQQQQPLTQSHSGDTDRELHESCPATEEDEGTRVRVLAHVTTGVANGDSGSAGRPSLVRVLLRQFGATMAVFVAQRLVSDAFLVSCPLILGQLISHLNDRPEGREWQGYVLALALFLSGTLRTVFYAAGSYRAYCVGLHIKSVVIGAVYDKALRINNAAKRRATSGEITSLMSVDAQRLQEFMSRLFFGVSVPVVLVAVLVIIYYYVDNAVLAGVIVLAALVSSTGIAGACQKKVQEELLVHKDLRVKVFSEILNGIKVLKLYAWEESFQQRVSHVREQEVRCLWRVALLYVVLGLCTNLMSYLVTLATYAWYVLSQRDHFLDASTAFAIMSLLSVLTPILESLGFTISFMVQAKVSVKRINDFLCGEELDFDSVVRNKNNQEAAIHVKRASFAWDDPEHPCLQKISLKVGGGRLVGVVGQVGAGKSSLLSCVLGDVTRLQGHVHVKGSVAYVSQQAWIQNGTVRDNVLFGHPYLEDRYTAVLRACQLERDLTMLPGGDMTEIGEKGTNLSGGQKQRVNLARAVYSDSDIYLLDDPLSAVDSHVGRAIFSDVIGPKGILKGKTRVLVTHGVHWLPLVDDIVVMKQGEISEVGSYSQLMQHNGDFAQFLRTFFVRESEEVDSDMSEEELTDPEVIAMRKKIWADVESATTDATDAGTSGEEPRLRLMAGLARRSRKRKDRSRRSQRTLKHKAGPAQEKSEAEERLEEQGKLTLSETLTKGRVSLPMYLHYPKAAGWVSILIAVLFFTAFRAFSVVANFWLRQWTEDPVLNNQSMTGSDVFVNTNHYYLTYYGLFGVLQVVLFLAYNGLYWTRTIQASRRLHDRMLTCLFRAPMAFFDTTPSGRVMNRISTDMEIVDNLMPLILREIVSTITVLIATIVVLLVTAPLMAVILVPVAVLCYFPMAAYIPVSRQCKRLEAVTRSPIFAHFGETVSGAATIRAYRATDRFIAESRARVDRNQVFYFTWVAGIRWIQMALDFVTNVVVFAAAMLEIVSPNPSGGSAGLSVSYALQLSYTLNYMVRMLTDFETNIVSVERIKEYSELPSEAPWVNRVRRPIPTWPPRGRLEFRDFQTRYRPGLELVLKGVTCLIQGGEKIGIVGRTGAGKSSLSLALFRLIEAEGGAVLIDGVNIADLGLHDLRRRLTILPQEPVLFSGSLRFNLDPFEEHSDEALWRALEQAHLRHFVSTLPGTLDFQCGEEGLNLSVGQRQLLCLARTLLRRTRVLVLDEATAAVDVETDALIQATVRQAFTHCTVLTIAHRLHTVLDCDRVLVLDAGMVQEFDSPQNLMAKPDSVFSAMLKDAGLAKEVLA
ncbi:multidrug resistance-associated protein 1-like isoform X2 [Babylonia areolata]